ncbi:hypothetical protein ACFL2I_06815, partial [Candidatus Omnitrophota bacterium]
KGKIYFTAQDAKSNIIKSKTLPIKGRTADYATLLYFIRPFLSHFEKDNYPGFYLVTSEPKLYKLDIQFQKYETLDLPVGKKEALKLRLIPDLGLIAGIFKIFVPTTFVWYEKDRPHAWLKYKGLETGLSSANIVTYISQTTKR